MKLTGRRQEAIAASWTEPVSETGRHWPMPPRKRHRRLMWLVLAAVAVIVLVIGGVFAFRLRAVANEVSAEADAGRAKLLSAGQLLKTGGFGLTQSQADQAGADFQAAERHFARARALLSSGFEVQTASLIPYADRQIKAAASLADFGIHVSRIGEIGMQAIRPLAAPVAGQKSTQEPGQRLLLAMQTIDPSLDPIERELKQAINDRARVPSRDLLPQLSSAVAALDARVNLATVEHALVQVRADEPGLRAVLGASGPRTYLVLQQDPAELRATGGFIGTVGFLSFDQGKMAPYVSLDIDTIDYGPHGFVLGPKGTRNHVDLPYPMQVTFPTIPSMMLRDANWSPDFPTASRQAEFLLHREVGKTVDGVIAIDPYVIERLLAIIGPVTIPSTGDVVDQNNFYAVTLNRVELNLSDNRKDFLAVAGKVILSKVLDLPSSKWPALLDAIQWGCQTRSVQAYFHASPAQALSDRYQCGGQVQAPAGDGLLVIDSNVGGNKDDFWMKRRFSLQVAVRPDGSARHTLTLHYDGLSSQGFLLTGRWGYTGWLRVYLPEASTVVSITPAKTKLASSSELGRQVLQGWYYVQFDHSTDVTIVYDEPPAVSGAANHQLQINWQKQSGRVADPISVTVTVPDGWRLRRATVDTKVVAAGPISSDLATDRKFTFDYQAK